MTWAAPGSLRPYACSSPNGLRGPCWSSTPLTRPATLARPATGCGRLTRSGHPGGSCSPAGEARGATSSTSRKGTRTIGSASSSRCTTQMMSNPSSSNGSLARPERGQALAAQIAGRPEPAAGRDRAADPGLLLHPRRWPAAARVPARALQAGHQPHAPWPLALQAAAPRQTQKTAGQHCGPGPGRGRRTTRSPASGSGRMTSPPSQLS